MRAFYKGFYRAFRRAAYVKVPLDAGDFSLIDRRVIDALRSMPEKQRFVRGLRAWVGFKQIGVPYVVRAHVRRHDEQLPQEPRLGAARDRVVLLRAA